MHHTSVPNIMKVIEPLFLDELRAEYDKARDSRTKLERLQERLGRIKIFDPACGSGNFLIIAYKELRELEMRIIKRIHELGKGGDAGAESFGVGAGTAERSSGSPSFTASSSTTSPTRSPSSPSGWPSTT